MRISLLFAEALSVCALLVGCGTANESVEQEAVGIRSQSIVGGSLFQDLPAVGALYYDGEMSCTGTLIGPRKVLTAGHCTSGVSASRMTFKIGPNADKPEATLRVSAVKPHPGFSFSTIDDDIGLVTLAQDAPVEPMKVVIKMESSWVGRNLVFVGYGVSDGYNQTGSGLKRSVTMPISEVSATQFRYEVRGRNTCSGDSGGPAFYKDSAGEHFVAGVTSYGDAYCTQFGVDTRVDTYLSFLGLSATPPETPPSTPSTPDDPCDGETYEGRCASNTLIWCEKEQVKKANCATSGKKCSYNSSEGYYDCL